MGWIFLLSKLKMMVRASHVENSINLLKLNKHVVGWGAPFIATWKGMVGCNQ
jgi:hypothetical protein